jgi:heparosan-N-sulfate-glucuronate 5-epimerase
MNIKNYLAYFGSKVNATLSYFGVKDKSYGRVRVTPMYDADDPMQYYFDLKVKPDYAGAFDSKGVPQYNYKGKLMYFPIQIAEYGMVCCLKYLAYRDGKYLQRFKIAADWLCDSQEPDGCWLQYSKVTKFNLESPWRSAMAQGVALSCLCRAYRLLHDNKYLNACKMAIRPFLIAVPHGGITREVDGDVFYEEYPSTKANHVLNGFIFSLLGLFDLARLDSHSEAAELFENGVKTLKKWLPRFDIGYWSLYHIGDNKFKNPASISYHNLHIRQLKSMYLVTGDEIFNHYSELWMAYFNGHFNGLRTLPNKILNNVIYGL